MICPQNGFVVIEVLAVAAEVRVSPEPDAFDPNESGTTRGLYGRTVVRAEGGQKTLQGLGLDVVRAV